MTLVWPMARLASAALSALLVVSPLGVTVGCGGASSSGDGVRVGNAGPCSERFARDRPPDVRAEGAVSRVSVAFLEETRAGAMHVADLALLADDGVAIVGSAIAPSPSLPFERDTMNLAFVAVVDGGRTRWARSFDAVAPWFDAAVTQAPDGAVMAVLPLDAGTAVGFGPPPRSDALAVVALDGASGETRAGALLEGAIDPNDERVALSTTRDALLLCGLFSNAHGTSGARAVELDRALHVGRERRVDDRANGCAVGAGGDVAFSAAPAAGDRAEWSRARIDDEMPAVATGIDGDTAAVVLLDAGDVVALEQTPRTASMRLRRFDTRGGVVVERALPWDDGRGLVGDGVSAWLTHATDSGLELELLAPDLSSRGRIVVREESMPSSPSDPALFVTAVSRRATHVVFALALATPGGDPHCRPPTPEWARLDAEVAP